MTNKIKSFIQLGILILAIILIISLIRSISKILGSNQKITDAQTKVEELQKENTDLTKELQTVKSTQFIEEEARDKLGLAKHGEIVVVLPDDNSLRALAPKIPEEKASLPISNWQKWLNLFL